MGWRFLVPSEFVVTVLEKGARENRHDCKETCFSAAGGSSGRGVVFSLVISSWLFQGKMTEWLGVGSPGEQSLLSGSCPPALIFGIHIPLRFELLPTLPSLTFVRLRCRRTLELIASAATLHCRELGFRLSPPIRSCQLFSDTSSRIESSLAENGDADAGRWSISDFVLLALLGQRSPFHPVSGGDWSRMP